MTNTANLTITQREKKKKTWIARQLILNVITALYRFLRAFCLKRLPQVSIEFH